MRHAFLAAFAAFAAFLLISPIADAGAPTERVITEAEKYLGKPWVFGGRDGRPGCRKDGKKALCDEGVDCLSLLFFAHESTCGTPWWKFSVMPSVSVREKQLGAPVPGLDGVLAASVNRSLFKKGDAIFFLLADYNLDADAPLFIAGEKKYGAWHTALVTSTAGGAIRVIHAKPGAEVTVEPLDAITFDALFVVRLPDRC